MKTMTIGNPAGRRAPLPLMDGIGFFVAWLRNPKSVAAVAPSGRALAELITRDVDAATGPVLELGPGTGVFTQAMINRGVPAGNLTLIEYSPKFAQLLRQRHPDASVVCMDAANLGQMTPADPSRYGAVICGLGLLSMAEEQIESVLKGAFARMRQGAAFYLFTYGRSCSVPSEMLARLDLTATRVGTAYLNFPPASVFRIVRRKQEGC